MHSSRWRAGVTAAVLSTAAATAFTLSAGAASAASFHPTITTHPGFHAVTATGEHHLLGTGPHTALGRAHAKSNITYSTNWGGYAADSTTYDSVTASWTQPTVTCNSSDEDSYSAFWVGLDGYSSSTVEQTGTEADCEGTTATYAAWYEAYPAASNTYSKTVKAGDSFTATVTADGDVFDLVIEDKTQDWTETEDVTVSGADKSSAEVIVEAPSSDSGVLPLSDFGTVKFTGAEANGTGFDSLDAIQMDIESSAGELEESTSSLSDNDFTGTWDSTGE